MVFKCVLLHVRSHEDHIYKKILRGSSPALTLIRVKFAARAREQEIHVYVFDCK